MKVCINCGKEISRRSGRICSKCYYSLHKDYFQRKFKIYQQEHREERTIYHQKYRQTPSGKSATAKAVKKYDSTHPERFKAWSKAADNIDLQPCIKCDNPRSHRHHPDPLKPLEVIMLCPLHHKEAHAINVLY